MAHVAKGSRPRRDRQKDAEERRIARENRSDEEQLKRLNSRPGEAKKEREKLEKRIAARKLKEKTR